MKKKLTFTLVIWLFIFVTFEIGVRTYDYISKTGLDKPEHTTDATLIFAPHPYTTYSANPSNINHNAQGYRAEKSKLYKADPGSINIVTLGGSSTYGTRVYTRDSYPYLLEEVLRKSVNTDKAINVINGGLGGYATPNIIALLSGKIVHLDPDIIIFYVGFNDAWTRLMFSNFTTDYSHAQKTWAEPDVPFWRYSRFLDAVAGKLGYPSTDPHIHSIAWQPMSGNPETNFLNSSANAFKANLMTLVGISRTHGAVPILVTQATDFSNHPLPDNNKIWSKTMKENTGIIRQIADEMSVDLIDIRRNMTDEKESFLDVLHMSGKGNRKRAEIIANYLIQNKLIGKNTKTKESATLDLITEYMRLMRADVFVKRVLIHIINEMRKTGIDISTVDEEKIISVFSRFKNVIAVYAPIYKHLSRETLISANKFFSSEMGEKFISSYARSKNSPKIRLTEDEFKKIQTFQSSNSWQEIQKQRTYINRDASIISGNIIKQFLSGELKLPFSE